MPRALHDESCESSFAQRPAQMRASIVQAVDLAAHLEQRIFPPVDLYALCAFRWNVLLRRQPDPHGITYSPRLKNSTSGPRGRPGQLSPQESNRSLPGELGCARVMRVRSVLLEKPVLCPRICVERDVLPPVVRRTFSRSCTTAGASNSSVSAKCPRKAALIWE